MAARPRQGANRTVQESFRAFSQRVSEGSGSPWTFIAALSGVIIWLVAGPFFHFSDTWQLTMSTICSIIPSLMVFLIQNMQNRDAKAMQLKLDELIRATGEARNTLIHLESMSDAELEALETEFNRVRGSRQRVPQAGSQGNDRAREESAP
jgi:low affinity Fe/Cu permease